MDYRIKVYGTEHCHDTQRSRAHLAQLGLEYQFIDIDKDATAEEQVIRWSQGRRVVPVIQIDSKGEHRQVIEPSNDELDQALRESRVDSEMNSRGNRDAA